MTTTHHIPLIGGPLDGAACEYKDGEVPHHEDTYFAAVTCTGYGPTWGLAPLSRAVIACRYQIFPIPTVPVSFVARFIQTTWRKDET